ncbi:MAG: nickel-dependent hydrogenase large subunit [Methylococcales bacterium]|nr:nickel-dependent hydrogenase large subunit [Methylococcales bacterium]
MIDTGKLRITLSCDNGKVLNVEIESTRPLHTSRLFIGKTPEQTLKILPLLFNVCGVAQSFAAFQALGIAQNSAETAARNLLLNTEIVREHCWWLLINTDKARLAPFLKYVADFKKALFASGDAFSLNSKLEINPKQLDGLIVQLETDLDALFLNQRQHFLDTKNEDDLRIWLNDNASIPALLLRDLLANNQQILGRCALRLLPTLTDSDLLTTFNSQTPTWQNESYETSCLNRQQTQPLIANLLEKYGNGLITRLVSRLFELANLPNVLRQNFIDIQTPSNPTKNEMGVAQIQASRGLLIHKVELKNGVIENYQIVAPTEWNFQPNGIAALSLQSLCVHNETLLRQHAAVLINAIDPCVGFELVID